MNEREHDLVVYGATGFVGELTAAHRAEHAPAGARIALAGRSVTKLEATRRRKCSRDGHCLARAVWAALRG
ncbi:MAG: hypothetical protein H7Y15_04095 [Pseudonocardia sp.]|nr:hypothetical protein [Pseudonocardia sp.]